MDRPLTVRLGSVLVAVVVALALAVAYLVGAAGHDANAATAPGAAEASGADVGTVRMVGRGQVTAVPDMATFAVAVTLKRSDLDTALGDASATMKRVLDSLGEYDVGKADVQTTGLSMSPEYDYHSYGPPTFSGYRVTQSVRVEVRTLSKAGAAITAAVTTGGNDVRVRNIRLQVSDPDAAISRARDAAIAEARTKAEQYAGAADQELGKVRSIKEISVSAPATHELSYRASYDALTAAKAPVPIRAGESDLTVRVEVVWELP
ncbi:MAG: SIMPL domain-containing protein [Nocardioidaceae bacterium]